MDSKTPKKPKTSTDQVDDLQSPDNTKLLKIIQQKFDLWLERAQYDIDSAQIMFDAGRWLYVTFMCQQCIEKLAKGLYIIYKDNIFPYSHNIGLIISKFKDKLSVAIPEETYNFFNELSLYYINDKQTISTQLNKEKAEEILFKTREVFAWLLTLKK
jgi:HEPN domain-containing protein